VAEAGAASLVDDHVAGHGEQPGPRRAVRVGGDLGVAPRAQQGLLDDVLGAGAVAGQPQRVAPQRGGVFVVEHAHHGGLRIVHSPTSVYYTASAAVRFTQSVRILGPSSVTATVCSQCAAREPSVVTTV